MAATKSIGEDREAH